MDLPGEVGDWSMGGWNLCRGWWGLVKGRKVTSPKEGGTCQVRVGIRTWIMWTRIGRVGTCQGMEGNQAKGRMDGYSSGGWGVVKGEGGTCQGGWGLALGALGFVQGGWRLIKGGWGTSREECGIRGG